MCLEKCCNTVSITSSGFAKTHHPALLGVYNLDDLSFGDVSYKSDAGYYLYKTNDGNWAVSFKIIKPTMVIVSWYPMFNN